MKNKLLLFLLLGCFHFQTKAQPINVKSTHPRVLLDSSIISRLQTRAANNTPEWQELQIRINALSGYSGSQIIDVVYEGQHYAFYNALSFYATGNTAHRDTAVSIFRSFFYTETTDSSMFYDVGYQSRSTMVEVSILYDWLYNYMTPQFRNDVRTRLIHWGNWILTQPVYGIWYGPYYHEGNNYTMGHFTGLAHLGLAIHSEDATNGNRFINVVDSIRPHLIHYANTRLKNGDAVEGYGYGAGYAINLFKALAAFKTATTNNLDLFGTTTYDEDVMKFLPLATLPDHDHMLPEGDWARESTGELWDYHKILSDIISSYSNDSITKRVAAYWGDENIGFSDFAVSAYRWFPFLFRNREINPLDYTTVPFYQDKYIYTDTSGTDQFIRRTGWNSNDLWVSYRGAARYADHSHNGSGHFSVYKNGWLLIDKNILTNSGIEGSDSMHNCTHVEFMNNFEMYPFQDYDNPESTEQKRKEFTNSYSYFWSNSTPIYAARSNYFNNVEKKEREFFFLPAIEKIFIFDMVETSNSNYDKWFGLNFPSTPQLANDSSYCFYSNGTSKATVYTAYPQNTSVVVWPNSIRIRNSNSQVEDKFVHLVSITGQSAPVENITPINIQNGRVVVSDLYGTYHKEALKDYVVLFATDHPMANFDSIVYDIPNTLAPVQNYIAGLDPLTTYYITSEMIGGNIRLKLSTQSFIGANTFTTSDAGILDFEIIDFVGIQDEEQTLFCHGFYDFSQKEFVLENNNDKNINVRIISIDGKIIFENILEKGISRVSGSNFNAGIYLIQFYDMNSSIQVSKKVMIH